MSWQKCPICEGTGTLSFLNYICPTCNGKRIISSVNGLPPTIKIHTNDRFCDIARFVMKERIADPQTTIEEIEQKWLSEKKSNINSKDTQNGSNIQSSEP